MENDDRTYETTDAQCNCLLPSQTPSNDTSQLIPLPSLSSYHSAQCHVAWDIPLAC